MALHKANLVWIASYPKSGNTWFRAFISSLLDNDEININRMRANLIYSDRKVFDFYTDIDSSYLTDAEAKMLLPEVYRYLSGTINANEYIKIHDAFILNKLNRPIIPTECTHCAIYIIRNPLDIAGSFSSHMGRPIDQTIDVMNKADAYLSAQKNNFNLAHQFPQFTGSWSDHVNSWQGVKDFPVLFIRYEDLLHSPEYYFTKAVDFIGIRCNKEKILKAINVSSFSNLRGQEEKSGFHEKDRRSSLFFRSGKAGNWINELTKEQALKIANSHKDVMQQFGYDTDIEKYY